MSKSSQKNRSTLQEPIKVKNSEYGSTNNINNSTSMEYAVSSMQGWRTEMEDSHYCDNNFDVDTQLFCVFDGHGGFEVAEFVAKHFSIQLKANQAYKAQQFKVALQETFLKIDEMLQTKEGKKELREIVINRKQSNPLKSCEQKKRRNPGCTANVTLIHNGTTIYVANAGDSRCVISCQGKQEELSYDHKPQNPLEKKRILKAGGSVSSDGRVNGNLNLSRSLGDFNFKADKNLLPEEQIITSMPDIISRVIQPNDEFLLIGCDGIWEMKSNQELIDICRLGLIKGQNLIYIIENLLDQIIAQDLTSMKKGCDNMTMILVKIKNNFSELEERNKESDIDSICWNSEDLKNQLLLNEENNNTNDVTDRDRFEDGLASVGREIKQIIIKKSDNLRDFTHEVTEFQQIFEKYRQNIQNSIQNLSVIENKQANNLEKKASGVEVEPKSEVKQYIDDENQLVKKKIMNQEYELEIENQNIKKEIDTKSDCCIQIQEILLNNSPCSQPLEGNNPPLTLYDPQQFEDQKFNDFYGQTLKSGENDENQNYTPQKNENDLLIKDDNKILEEQETVIHPTIDNTEKEENDSKINSSEYQCKKEDTIDLHEKYYQKLVEVFETKKQKKIADKFSIAIMKQTNQVIFLKLFETFVQSKPCLRKRKQKLVDFY